ncbi:MAG: hypothetical protein IPI87_05930 [Betaproteobacteria bacterium]|nr:hypothetical protein [Betaproteobacteria bacterium]
MARGAIRLRSDDVVEALKVEVGSGQFTKIEPGIGKLLGVLSLQALPRRIAPDFRDVFSEGFAFDRIDGNVRIARGVMTTDDLRLVGPAASTSPARPISRRRREPPCASSPRFPRRSRPGRRVPRYCCSPRTRSWLRR